MGPHHEIRCAARFRFGGHMLFYPSEKLALFIDGANLYGAAKGLQFDIDYKRLLELFARKGTLVRAFYYTAVAEDQEFSPLRPLVDWLDYNGFSVVTKPLKEFTDAQGRRRVKGNMDIELAIDVMEMAGQCRPCGDLLRRRRFPPPGRSGAAARAAASAWSPPSAPSRPWWPTNCAARPTISSSWTI